MFLTGSPSGHINRVWPCPCGYQNTGNVCTHCGSPRAIVYTDGHSTVEGGTATNPRTNTDTDADTDTHTDTSTDNMAHE